MNKQFGNPGKWHANLGFLERGFVPLNVSLLYVVNAVMQYSYACTGHIIVLCQNIA